MCVRGVASGRIDNTGIGMQNDRANKAVFGSASQVRVALRGKCNGNGVPYQDTRRGGAFAVKASIQTNRTSNKPALLISRSPGYSLASCGMMRAQSDVLPAGTVKSRAPFRVATQKVHVKQLSATKSCSMAPSGSSTTNGRDAVGACGHDSAVLLSTNSDASEVEKYLRSNKRL